MHGEQKDGEWTRTARYVKRGGMVHQKDAMPTSTTFSTLRHDYHNVDPTSHTVARVWPHGRACDGAHTCEAERYAGAASARVAAHLRGTHGPDRYSLPLCGLIMKGMFLQVIRSRP